MRIRIEKGRDGQRRLVALRGRRNSRVVIDSGWTTRQAVREMVSAAVDQATRPETQSAS